MSSGEGARCIVRNSLSVGGQSCGVEFVSDAAPHAETDVRAYVARLFDDHADAIHAYAVRRVGEHDAADVLSETFVIALQQFARFDPLLGTDRGWLFGIANNVLRHHWRTEARRLRQIDAHRPPVPIGDPLIAVDARLDARLAAAPLVDSLLAADPDERDLILMWAWEQLSYADIATAMNLPIGTVRSRLHRARKRLEPFRPEGATS